ncbi:SCO family protein [Alsobacter sp. R-9]
MAKPFRLLCTALLLALAAPAAADAPRVEPLRAAAAGGFRLADTAGREVSPATLAGRPYLLFLGFTHCPDICPDTLQRLTMAMAEAGDAADRVTVLFASVDPERDSAPAMKAYLEAFDPRIRGVTGRPAAVRELVNSLGVTVRKVPSAGGYTVDHPLQVFMTDAAGRPAGIIRYTDTPKQAADKIKALASR